MNKSLALFRPATSETPGYIFEPNSESEQFCFVEMRFHRFIICDGQIFPSTAIHGEDFDATTEPRRLTLNFFAERE